MLKIMNCLPKNALGSAGYYSVLTGKWHVGKGLSPQDVGFDEFYGYYPAQKEVSQRVDPRRYPDLVFDEEKLADFEGIAPDAHLIDPWL